MEIKRMAYHAISRRNVLRGLCTTAAALPFLPSLVAPVMAQGTAVPLTVADPGSFIPEGLREMERGLYELPTTSLLIYEGGRPVYQYGNGRDVSYLASARKSILSMLYGNYVASGKINLDANLAELDIQDNETLSDAERQATVRDLLTSSSGVYHPAGSPGGNDNNPERGSVPPGTRFQYNNWDFNVLGAIFEKQTGKTIFSALESELATPLGFEDFEPGRQRMMGYGDRSRYLAYHMFLSTRDMGKLGQLMVQGGKWNGQQVIPADWVAESTKERVTPEQTDSPNGYGYLWWTPQQEGAAWEGSYLAYGNLGQYILCLPALNTVIVHRRAVTDEFAVARNLGETTYLPEGVKIETFLDVAAKIIAARG
ncbi:Amide hydrolase [Cereibacter sphaeroides KD131]|nr:Amide hydrolase [Cereibacter sphaeroides KD131]